MQYRIKSAFVFIPSPNKTRFDINEFEHRVDSLIIERDFIILKELMPFFVPILTLVEGVKNRTHKKAAAFSLRRL